MKERLKAPELRFDGFTDDWEERKLSSMTNYKNGKSHEDKQSTSGKLELINLNSISISGGLKHSGKFIDEADDTLQKDDLVMILSDVGHGDLLGRVALIPEDDRFVLNQRVALLRPNTTADPQFLFSYINAHQYYFKAQGAGMSQLNISKGSVENFISFVPIIEEQKKIGAFFKRLDDTIALHQRKLDLLKEQKKGYLQKMFPKNGAKVPELRFAGFADDWEDRKLGDFLKTPEKVKAHIQSKDDLMTLKLNLGGLESGSKRETLELGSTIYYKRKSGQFIYGKQNFFNGSMAIIPIDLDGKATSGDVPSLDVIGILSEYLYVYVSRGDYWKSKESEASGTGSKRIHEKTLQGFDIKVPSTQNEQRKIGSFFKQLDDTIALHQRKLDLLKERKKGFLQKMFV